MSGRKGRLSLDQRAALPIEDDNPEVEHLQLSRQEICQTEIKAAVRLFILDKDPISAHLLASAAIEIMTALSDEKSGVGLNDVRALIKSSALSTDLSKEVFEGLLHPYNFLKHGSSDSNVKNDFSIEFIVMTIYIAIHSYKLLFAELPTEMKVFYGMVQSWRIQWWEGTTDFDEKLQLAQKLLTNLDYR